MKIPASLRLTTPWIAVGLLFAANVTNYADRYVFSALVPFFQSSHGLTDGQVGTLGSAFLWGFIIISPFVGRLSVRLSRAWALALAILFWSIATLLMGILGSFVAFLFIRLILGASQSVFTSLAPTVVDDVVNATWKGRSLSVFLMAIPIGSALGYMYGGYMGQAVGWQTAFVCAGLIGLPLAILALFLPNARNVKKVESSWLNDLRGLASSSRYVWTALGYAAQTFALGGFAFWAPTYLDRVLGLPAADGAIIFGGVIVVTGFAGTLIGGWLADKLIGGDRLRNYLMIGVIATVIAAPFAYWAILTRQPGLFFIFMAILQVAVFATLAPISSVFLGSVPPALRVAGLGLSVFMGRLLGDAVSIWLIGFLSDLMNDLGRAMFVVPAAFLVTIACWGMALRPVKKQSKNRNKLSVV